MIPILIILITINILLNAFILINTIIYNKESLKYKRMYYEALNRSILDKLS
jgi:NADH:ubiquinone oxidoreductase subunit 3 (subunit A)